MRKRRPALAACPLAGGPRRQKGTDSRDAVQRAAHTADMPVRLHHIVVDAHDLPGLARFWTQALGWKVLSERENEIVIGAGENAPAGMCFMPVTDPKTVKNRVHFDLASSAAARDQEIDRLLALGARRADIGQTGAESWTVLADPEETSSASCARRKRSSVKAQH
jgi:Glyoxalase-like domain